jgi:hypothetical protein
MATTHFTGQHHAEETYGPFSFLNPTSRKSPHPFRQEKDSSQEEVHNGETQHKKAQNEGNPMSSQQQTSGKKDELRAEDVQRLYRTRDNRKGRYSKR